MVNNRNFSIFLSELLSILNISNNKLAKAINVDPSLISRWKTGKRKISPDSNYLKLTADYLYENVFCDCQKESILQLESKYNLIVNGDFFREPKEYLYKLLLSALQNTASFQNTVNTTTSMNENGKDITSFFCDVEVISGHKDVINAGIELLKTLPEKPDTINDPILITFLTETNSFSDSQKTLKQWNSTLIEVQKKGWSVVKLIKINDNNIRNSFIINELLNNIDSKNYNEYYINKYDIVLNFRELIFVPSVGSLFCLCSENARGIDNAFLIKDKKALNIFKGFVSQHFIHSTPLIKNNPNVKLVDWITEFAAFEEEAAPSFAFNSCLNYTKLPIEIHEPFTESDNEIIKLHENIKKAFTTKLEQFNFYEIHSKKYIKNIIKQSKHKNSKLKPSYVIEAFEYIIYLLGKYENYNIALLDEDSENSILDDLSWNIKDSSAVLIGKLCENHRDGNKACLKISEPNIINTFNKHFIDLWESIAPINKDKEIIISWFKAQIKSLQDI